eukprot:351621-Chlamydomonas_euryale.AAC.5
MRADPCLRSNGSCGKGVGAGHRCGLVLGGRAGLPQASAARKMCGAQVWEAQVWTRAWGPSGAATSVCCMEGVGGTGVDACSGGEGGCHKRLLPYTHTPGVVTPCMPTRPCRAQLQNPGVKVVPQHPKQGVDGRAIPIPIRACIMQHPTQSPASFWSVAHTNLPRACECCRRRCSRGKACI